MKTKRSDIQQRSGATAVDELGGEGHGFYEESGRPTGTYGELAARIAQQLDGHSAVLNYPIHWQYSSPAKVVPVPEIDAKDP